MIAGIIGVIYFSKKREENPFLFCFNFFSREPKYDPQGKKSFPYQRIQIFLFCKQLKDIM